MIKWMFAMNSVVSPREKLESSGNVLTAAVKERFTTVLVKMIITGNWNAVMSGPTWRS